MAMRVRPGEARDYDAYLRLFAELGVDDQPPALEDWILTRVPDIYVAERGAEVVGYALCQVMAHTGYLRNLVVAPAARRRGVAQALMEACAARLRAAGCTDWRLNVKPQNLAAIRLYRAWGFERVHESVAIRFPVAAIDGLPSAAEPADVLPIAPRDDAAVEAATGLVDGQLAKLRTRPKSVLLQLCGPDGVRGVAALDPGRGAFPFRVAEPTQARALLAALRPHLADAEFVTTVAEGDAALAALLLAHGGVERMRVDHYRGPVPTEP